MDEAHIDYCKECLKDHEIRLRDIEKNNKEQVKLYVEREKLDIKINALDDKCDFKFQALEKLLEAKVVEVKTEQKVEKKESKSDIYAAIGMIISIGTFIILLFKVVL